MAEVCWLPIGLACLQLLSYIQFRLLLSVFLYYRFVGWFYLSVFSNNSSANKYSPGARDSVQRRWWTSHSAMRGLCWSKANVSSTFLCFAWKSVLLYRFLYTCFIVMRLSRMELHCTHEMPSVQLLTLCRLTCVLFFLSAEFLVSKSNQLSISIYTGSE